MWVEITCTGKMVDDFNEYVDTTIVRYVMVEVYNPIVSIDVNTKNVTLYPYDEVGEQNRDLSEKTFIITLNKDNLAPTYYKLETSYENTREGVTIFEFEEIDNYQYKVSLKTRTYSIGGINEKVDDVSIDFSATNFNISFRVQVSIKIESPVLVDKIETINVPNTGIYMSALEQNELARTFKIMTKVLPENALNKDLIFRFEPDFGTNNNILSINNEGIITLRGNVGGSGNILVIPADGRMVDATGREYYRENIGDVLIRIPIVVADGSKEETALRISSLDQITNKNLHYLLIQDVVDFSFETLFEGETFEGGLYGKANAADGFVATITIKGGSLFDILSEKAIIKNINIAGMSNASGMVANVSNGTIQNVNVNVYNDGGVYKATTVNSTADYAGGLVGENNGLITGSIFAGSISGKTVGGLVGINKATITDSKVELYNLPTGDTMSFSGDVVGGLVGEVAKYSIIQKSYIYNYSDNNIATTMGALVGHIATDSFVVSKCFAYNVVKQSTSSAWYHTYEASLDLDDVIYNIIDSYISYIDGSDNYKFYAHMVDRFNQVKIVTTKSYPDIYLGTAAVWNVDGVTNGGYAFLNGVIAEQALTSEQLANMGIVDTNLSMQEATYTTEGGDNYTIAVMFVYKTNGVALTTDEQGEITLLNTISISELVGSALASGLIVSSSNTNIIDTTAVSVIVRNTGVVTLTLQSKYDYEQQPKQIKVMVVNKIQDFKLVYNGYTLNSESVLPVKNGNAESVQSQVDTTIALVNREIALKQNDFTVGVYNEDGSDATFVIGRKLGTHVISSNFGDSANISFVLEMDSINNNALLSEQEKQEFAKIIERNNIVLAVRLSKGADKVETINVKKANISPIDVLNFDAYIISDLDDTLEGMEAFVFDENGISLEGTENVFDIVIEQKSQTFDAETGKYKIVYNVSVSIKTEYKSIRFEGQKYTLRLSANSDREVYTQVEISVATQEVLRVDFNHYPQMYSNQAGTMYATYQPSNVLSPNRYGLLEISLYPNYASYDYITVTAQAVNGEKLGLVALQKNGTVFNTENAENFVFIENGVRIYRKNNTADLGIFYVKTIASANVKLNSVYSIEIKVYNEQSQTPLMTDSFNLIIVPQEKAGISINGVTGTTVALKGETLVADIMVEQIQSAPSVQILNLELTDTSTNATVLDVVLENENYGTKYKLYKATIKIPENAVSGFTIRATTSREINNELQYEVSDMKVYLYEFALDPETSGVKNETGNDVFVANKIFAKQLDINIGAKYYGINKAFYDSFLTSKIFYGENLRVNEEFNAVLDPAMNNNLKYNLYYVNNNTTTPIYNTETNTFNNNSVLQFDEVESESGDGYVLTVLGLVNTTQNMRLIINYQVKTDNGAYTTFVYEYDFKIKVEQYTDEDVPETISDANQFIAMADEEIEEPKDYILTKDIYLYEWEALPDTSKIKSLDGNGFTITIMNFKTELEDTSTLNLALFNQVSQNTTLKNIRLNLYHVGEVQIDTNSIKNFNYAPIAIVNHGIITNTEVVAYKKATNVVTPKNIGINASLPVVNDINSKIAGFVIENRGAITNSRVGGEKIKEVVVYDDGTVHSTNITLPMMTISGKGEMAGFVYNNTGLVSSSFANNIRIINSTDIDYTTVTSGFVAYNTGSVLMSYVKGVKRNDTEIHATKYGIETAGVSTGFVYDNDGVISDSYSNITLTNTSNNPGRTSSGFVYSNRENGQISTSYSFSRIIGSTTTQMNFSGVNERGDYLNKGRITNSYYYDGVIDENLSSVEDEYGKTAIRVTNVNVTDVFYGFSFETYGKENGIWTITATGPELIAANSETMSIRYKVGEVFAYATGYSYGSKVNPIIIRDAKEYNEVLGNSKRTPVQANYSDGFIYGSYRMVNNIYLNTLNSKDATENGVTDYKLTSASMTLTGRYSSAGSGTSIGRFDGNGLSIYGLALSDTGVTAATDFGLFAKIEQDAMVMNVNIILGAKNQENNVFGIEAKNIQNVGVLAGSVHSANVVNVSVRSAYEGASEVTVRGKNIVGGIIGNVTGNSYLANLSTKDISVRAVMNLATTELSPKTFNEYSRSGNNGLASYAGGVIGAYDYYTDATYNNLTFSNMYITSNPNALMLKTKGIMRIDGSTVGGVIGYVGPLTLIQDMLLELIKIEDETARNTQAITTYGGFAGGLVGYNKGYLRQVRAEHEEEYQQEIEENVNKYYTTVNNDSIDRGNMQVFANTDYKPYAIGGLVGIMNSGKIEKAYSKINTINDEAKYAGGIIGYIIDVVDVKPEAEDSVNIDTCLEEVYAFGDVRAKEKTSGIVGRIDNTGVAIEFDKVNAINYWGDWILEDNYADFVTNLNAFISYMSKQNLDNGSAITGEYYSSFADIKFTVADGDGSKVVSLKNKINSTTEGMYEVKFAGNGSYMSSYYDIASPEVSGEKVDVVFVGQEWDKRAWDRDEDELLPHMKFGYISEYFLIRTKTDLNLMRIYKTSTFIIVGQSESGGSGMVEIDSNFPAITGFNGTLRGKDATGKFGFTINANTMTHALFSNTNDAQFIDFSIQGGPTPDGSPATLNMSSSVNAVLVNNAEGGVISNVQFSNLHVVTNKDAEVKTAIAVANSANIAFNNVSFNLCKLTVTAKTADVGMLSANIAAPATIDVKKFTNIKAVSSDILVRANTVNVGAIAGRIKGSYALSYSTGSAIEDVNVQVKAPADTTLETQEIDAGLAFGEASSVSIGEDPTGFVITEDEKSQISYSTFRGTLSIDRGEGDYRDVKLNAGGMVGHATSDVNLYNIRSIVDIKVENANSTNNDTFAVGGVIGKGGNISVKNAIVGYRNEWLTPHAINIENVSGNINVGGVVGYVQPSLKNVITNIYSDLDINVAKSTELNNINCGGIVGLANVGIEGDTDAVNAVDLFIGSETTYAHELMPKLSLYTGEIKLAGAATGIVNIGGISGDINTLNVKQSATIANAISGGEIVFDGFEMKEDSTLNVGGLSGSLDTNVLAVDNAAFGDISLSPYRVTPTKEMIEQDGNPKTYGLTKVHSMFVGGLVGSNSSGYMSTSTTVDGETVITPTKGLAKNLALTTIINLKDKNLVVEGEEYSVNALVGVSSSNDLEYPENTESNKYNHVMSFATDIDKVGVNIEYSSAKEMLNRLVSCYENKDYEAMLPRKVVDYVDYTIQLNGDPAVDPDVDLGTKLNPILVNDLDDLPEEEETVERRKYYYISQDVSQTRNSLVDLTNAMLFSDGKNVINTSKNAFIKNISADSFVSGIVVRPEIKAQDGSIVEGMASTYVSALAIENKGYIFASNVTGISNNGDNSQSTGTSYSDKPASIKSEKGMVAGFVGVNKGVIKDSFTFANVLGNTKEAEDIVAGMVATNQGEIYSSYTSGSVQITESAKAYAFANGNAYDCFTIAKAAGVDSTKLFAFDTSEEENIKVENCVYDAYATEVVCENSENFMTITDFLTNTPTPDSRQMLDAKVTNFDLGKNFAYNATQNYGYPSFSINGYKDVAYMQHQTAIKIKEKMTYQIPNIGILEQLRYGSDKNYVIVNDINAKFISEESEVAFPEFSLHTDGVVDGTYNGAPHTIKNLKVTSALFDNVLGTVKNLTLDNFSIDASDRTAEDSANYGVFGLLTNKNSGTISNVCISGFNTEESVLSEDCDEAITFGLIAGVNQGKINNSYVISKKAEKEGDSASVVVYAENKELTFGAIVGRNDPTDSEKGVYSCNLSTNLNVYLKTDVTGATYYMGGIVGENKGNVVSSYLASGVKLNFLTSTKDITVSHENSHNNGHTLYAGGIAGKSADSALIKTCYTTIDTAVTGGSEATTKTAYVAGISGYNGKIEECYNRANVYSHAIVRVENSGAYEPVSAGLFKPTYFSLQNDVQLFATYNQVAYASGIVNSSGTLNATKSINYGKVKGGMKTKTFLGYFDLDEGAINKNKAITQGVAILLGFWDEITDPMPETIGPVPFKRPVRLAGAIGMGAAIYLGLNAPFAVYGHYVGYTNANNGNLSTATESGFPTYFLGAQKEAQADPSFVMDLGKLIAVSMFKDNDKIQIQVIMNFLRPGVIVGTPNYSGNVFMDVENSNRFTASGEFGALKKFTGDDGKTYVKTLNVDNVIQITGGTPELTLYDIYYNGISAKTSSGAFSDTSFETNNLYYCNSEVLGRAVGDKYWTNDIKRSAKDIVSGKETGNVLVYKADSEDVRTKLLQTATIPPMFEGWVEAGENEYVPKDSVEVKCVEAAELLDTEKGHLAKVNNTVVINVADEFTLKTVQNLVNKYEDFVKDLSAEDKSLESYTWIESAFDPAYAGTRLAYEIHIKNNIVVTSNWIPLGTDPTRPFAGTIVGNENEIHLLTIKSTGKDIGFIANAHNTTIKDLKLSIGLEGCYDTEGHTMGGFIGKATGTTRIENSMFTRLEVTDYTINDETLEIKDYGKVSTIGGYIGTAAGNVTITGFDGLSESENSYMITSKASRAYGVGYIGGIIGEYIGTEGLTISNVFTPTIKTEKSYNTIVGGIIGKTRHTEAIVAISNAKTTGNIEIVSEKGVTEVVVGGVIGESYSALTLDGVEVLATSIAADLSAEMADTKTYSAGVVGKLYGALEMTNSIIGPTWSSSVDRLYISSGLKQMTRAKDAYAGELYAWKDTTATISAGSSNTFNAKAIAIATYNYTNAITFVEDADGKTTGISDVDFNFVSTALKIQDTIHGENRIQKYNGVKVGYTRVSIIETQKQEKSNTNNSHIIKADGTVTNYGQYNYKKSYFIIYTEASILNAMATVTDQIKPKDYPYQVYNSSGEKQNITSYNPTMYKEKIYQLDIYFGIGDENKDINYSFGYTFDSVVENTYVLVRDVFDSFSKDISKRYLTTDHLFMPKQNSTVVYGKLETHTKHEKQLIGTEYTETQVIENKVFISSGVVYDDGYAKTTYLDNSVEETIRGNNPLYNRSSYDAVSGRYSTVGASVFEDFMIDGETGARERDYKGLSNGLLVEVADGNIVLKEQITVRNGANEPVTFTETILEATKNDLSSLYKEFEHDKKFSVESLNVDIDMVQIGNNLFTIGSSQYKYEGSQNRNIVGSKYLNSYYIISDIEDDFVKEQIYTAVAGKIMFVGEISYRDPIKTAINALLEGKRLTRTGLFFPNVIGLMNQSNDLLPFDRYQEATSELQFTQTNYANIVILNNHNAIHLALTQDNSYTYTLTYSATGWDFKQDASKTQTATEFTLGRDVETASYNEYGSVMVNANNYSTTLTTGTDAYIYKDGKAVAVTVEGSTLTYQETSYTIEEKQQSFEFEYTFDNVTSSYTHANLYSAKRVKIDGTYYYVFDGNYLSGINNGEVAVPITVSAEPLGTDFFAKVSVDTVEYDLFNGTAVNNEITIGDYKIIFTIENGMRKYVIKKSSTIVYEIEGSSFDKQEDVIDGDGAVVDTKNVVNGNINADPTNIDKDSNYITLDGSNLVVHCDNVTQTFASGLIKKQYEHLGYTILINKSNNTTTISREVEDAEGNKETYSATISGSVDLDNKNMYLRSVNDIAKSISADNSFINCDNAANYVCINGTYYDSKLKSIKYKLGQHPSRDLEVLAIYNTDGDGIVYVYNLGSINSVITDNFINTTDCQFTFNEDFGVPIINIKQNGTTRYNLDDEARIIKDYYSKTATYISSVTSPNSVSLNVIETEEYIKYVYEGSVITCDPTYTQVELFPWNNTQKFVFKIGDGTTSNYYGPNGGELNVSIGEETAPTENLTNEGHKISKVITVEHVINDTVTSYKRIYVFNSEVTKTGTYVVDGVTQTTTMRASFSVIESTSSDAFSSVAITAATDSDTMKITFENWPGGKKEFDAFTGSEVQTET